MITWIDVCDMETGEVLAQFKPPYFAEQKRKIHKWIAKNGYKLVKLDREYRNFIIWVILN